MDHYLKEFTFGELYLRHAIDYAPDASRPEMHLHNGCEIFCFVSGKAEYLVESARYPLEAGSLLIMRPAESHIVRILGSKRYERYTVNFPLSAADAVDPERVLMKPFLDRPLGAGNLYLPSELGGVSAVRSFERIFSRGDDYAAEVEARIRLLSILDAISAAYQRRADSDLLPAQNLSGQILSYITEHLFDELSIPMLAERFFVSRSQFSRIFKNAAGVSPWEYITLKRLTAAREKIHSGVPASKACVDCGFGDYSAFYRAHKKLFGTAPKYEHKAAAKQADGGAKP